MDCARALTSSTRRGNQDCCFALHVVVEWRGSMSDRNAASRHRQRAAELRGLAADEMNSRLRYQLFEMAAEYERLAISAEGLEGIERCERDINAADILPFGPRG